MVTRQKAVCRGATRRCRLKSAARRCCEGGRQRAEDRERILFSLWGCATKRWADGVARLVRTNVLRGDEAIPTMGF